MNQQIVFGYAILANGDHFRVGAIHTNALLPIFSEGHRLPMLEIQHTIGTNAAVSEIVESVVVKDIAVLIDLYERNAFVFRGCLNHTTEVFDVNVDRARDKSRLTRDRQRQRIDRVVDSSRRSRLRLLAELGSRTVLAFSQTVDTVVEKYVVDIQIPPDRVHEVIAADGQRVAIACDYRDTQLRGRTFDSGRNRRRTTVDAVEPICVHVVRKA